MRIEARDLCVALGGRPVLQGVDCAFAPGWTAIVGPNGAGKSTLLRALGGLVPLEGGQVLLDGRDAALLAPRARARLVGWLDQQGRTSGELSARETVALGRLAHLGLFARPGPADERAIDEAMHTTGWPVWADTPLPMLSGGERQRVLLARALATEAPVLLLDEPMTHLDPPHQVAIARLLRRIAHARTIVCVMHDLPLALQADRILVLDAGRVRAEAPAEDPQLHAALCATFGHAVRVERLGERLVAIPDL